jgi:hypothetical protein
MITWILLRETGGWHDPDECEVVASFAHRDDAEAALDARLHDRPRHGYWLAEVEENDNEAEATP